MSNLLQSSTAELFKVGNYATVAMKGSPEEWQTYAALGLIGKTQEALEGLSRFDNEDAYFYSAVAIWIGGDEEKAAHILETIPTPHAQNLLTLIRKPQIHVLAQLPWSRAGSWDLLTASTNDSKFKVKNISFHPQDLPNKPYADIHQYYDHNQPPDFYICQMVEWHFIPPNLQQLPCPTFGQTGDYDLHIQAVYPWLQLFDEIIVTDQSEWQDVHQLVKVPVSTFPKSFGIPDILPPISQISREFDLFLSGTVTHPYHPDKAQLIHQILRMSNLKIKIVNGFQGQKDYYKNLSNSKVCFTYIRHPAALPTRGIEVLSMGCALVVQKDSVLTLFVGEEQGVLTYEFDANNLAPSIQQILEQWPKFEQRAKRGAEIVRREFAASRVASQYLRFLTFLAAKPRVQRQVQPMEQLVQKRSILQKGWLPSYDFCHSPILKHIGIYNSFHLEAAIKKQPISSHLYIDLARESVLYNYHRALAQLIPVQEWLSTLISIYETGLARFPQSLVLRFNFIRVVLHFGQPQAVSEALELLEETLSIPVSHWQIDVMEDVFPWDFCPSFFNYRKYFDLVTKYLKQGTHIESELCQLILASLHYYIGFYFNYYQGFYSRSLDQFKQANSLDPEFPYYKINYAKQLIQRGLPEDYAEAESLLLELATNSILFLEAFALLEQLQEKKLSQLQEQMKEAAKNMEFELAANYRNRIKYLPDNPQLEELAVITNRAINQIKLVENFVDAPLQPTLKQTQVPLEQEAPILLQSNINQNQVSTDKLLARIQAMESSKFWKLRTAWFRFKFRLASLLNVTEEDFQAYSLKPIEDSGKFPDRIQAMENRKLQSLTRVQAMESSKFWQLRQVWLQLKRALRLTKEV